MNGTGNLGCKRCDETKIAFVERPFIFSILYDDGASRFPACNQRRSQPRFGGLTNNPGAQGDGAFFSILDEHERLTGSDENGCETFPQGKGFQGGNLVAASLEHIGNLDRVRRWIEQGDQESHLSDGLTDVLVQNLVEFGELGCRGYGLACRRDCLQFLKAVLHAFLCPYAFQHGGGQFGDAQIGDDFFLCDRFSIPLSQDQKCGRFCGLGYREQGKILDVQLLEDLLDGFWQGIGKRQVANYGTCIEKIRYLGRWN